MPRQNYADITIVLDRSGSMSAIQDATIRGFNTFVAEQRQVPGDGCWSLVQFDDQYEIVYAQCPQNHVEPLTPARFQPRGSTALIDAVCRTIDDTGLRLANQSEAMRPDKVLIVIITDGHENASRQFNRHDLNQRIAHQRDKYNWTFLFLGANQDAISEAAKYGIAAGAAMTYTSTQSGVGRAYGELNIATRKWKTEGNKTAEDLFGSAQKEIK